MHWDSLIKGYNQYLKLEKSLSQNSIDAYLLDINKLKAFALMQEPAVELQHIDLKFLRQFLTYLYELGISHRTQARIISGIKSFYKFLIYEKVVENDPTLLLESPKLGMKLPEVLSIEEIDQIMGAIDLSKPEGQRNRAIIETLYSCGLRVSELTNLLISNIYFKEGFVKVVGKGNKERLVPMGGKAIKEIQHYFDDARAQLNIQPGHEDFVFLNRRGKQLTRVMIFTIIKDLVDITGIQKNVSPHTFRHSFATHLIEGGADLRAIQDMLGHESITTTEIYTHLDKDFLRDAILTYHPRS